MYFACHIAAWLGIPAGAVIVVMLILRKRLRELHLRSRQRRATENVARRTRTNDIASVRSEWT